MCQSGEMREFPESNSNPSVLNTNILNYYIEQTLSHYWFYDPVMSLPMYNGGIFFEEIVVSLDCCIAGLPYFSGYKTRFSSLRNDFK